MIQTAFVAIIALASTTRSKNYSKNAIHPTQGDTVDNMAVNGKAANQPNAPKLKRVRRIDWRNEPAGVPKIDRKILKIDQVRDAKID